MSKNYIKALISLFRPLFEYLNKIFRERVIKIGKKNIHKMQLQIPRKFKNSKDISNTFFNVSLF